MNEPSTLDIVNKLPITLYFASIPDRQQVLKYINYLYINVPTSKDVLPDKLFREVIAKHLRIVNMKIIEPEILIVIALNKITLSDFSLPSDELIKNVISENQEQYEFDILYRVLSQIMNKIPRDLKERITGKQKLQIFHLVSKFIKLDKSILEKFIAFDPSLNTPISMELNENDYKTLNEKYLKELYKFQKQHSYLNSNSLEYGALASELYQESELDAKLNGDTNYNDNGDGNPSDGDTGNFKTTNIRAQYIDKNPDLMLGTKDNILYYYDSGSGTISEMPLNSTQVPVSISDLKSILTTNKIKQGDIADTINLLTATTIPNISTSTTIPTKQWAGRFVNSIGSMYTSISNTILPKPKPTPTPTPTPTPIPTGDSSSNDNSINNNINNINNKAPIPPEFLKKLYNIKNQYNNNSGDGSDSYGGGDGSFGGGSYGGSASSRTNPTYANGKYMSNNAVNLDIKFNLLKQSYNKDDDKTPPDTISHFSNINDNDNDKEKTNNTISHNNVVDKIKNNNKKIENIAIGFITSIILIFLLVIYNNIRNNIRNNKK